MTYFITFACYGSHLHGTPSGSVDRKHNLPGSRVLEADEERSSAELRRMDQPPYELDAERRQQSWPALWISLLTVAGTLLAAHVRASHVHVVIDAESALERIMNDIKSYASRRLNEMGLDEPGRKRWARHALVMEAGECVGRDPVRGG